MMGGARGLAAAVIAVAAPLVRQSYGETLLDTVHRHHPELMSAQIETVGRDGKAIVLARSWAKLTGKAVGHPLEDANGQPVGTIRLALRCADPAETTSIVREISRRVYVPDVLAESDPFVPGSRRAPAGQALVDELIDADPALVTLALHVTPPGDQVNRIVASSFGRIGKAADADDAHVIGDGAVLRELTNGGRRVAVELPLLDRRERTIGALSTSFRVGPPDNPERLAARAVALRDALARRIFSLSDLFGPVTVSRKVKRLGRCP